MVVVENDDRQNAAKAETAIPGLHSGRRQSLVSEEVRQGDLWARPESGYRRQVPGLHALAADAGQGVPHRLLPSLAVSPVHEQQAPRRDRAEVAYSLAEGGLAATSGDLLGAGGGPLLREVLPLSSARFRPGDVENGGGATLPPGSKKGAGGKSTAHALCGCSLPADRGPHERQDGRTDSLRQLEQAPGPSRSACRSACRRLVHLECRSCPLLALWKPPLPC
jgi:hypothetical protein